MAVMISYPAPAALVEHCLRHKRIKRPSGQFSLGKIDPTSVIAQIQWVKTHAPIDDPNHPFTTYDAWIESGFAFKLEFGDAGFDVWSATFDDRVNHDEALYKWEHSFSDVPHAAHVTMGTWIDRLSKLGCPIHCRPLASVMFAGIGDAVAKIAAAAGADLASTSIFGRADEQARAGLPIIQDFLNATGGEPSRPVYPDYPQLPTECANHPAYTALNDMLGRIFAMAEGARFKPGMVTDALGVLSVIHGETFDAVVRRLQMAGIKIPRAPMKLAGEAFQERVERAFVPLEGWILDSKGRPESDNSDNIPIFFRVCGLELRWNAWLEQMELRGGNDPTLSWKEWTYFDDTVAAKLRTRANRTKTRFLPGKDFFWESCLAFAHASVTDPAAELLAELEAQWDGVPRLDGWLSKVCHLPDDAYHRAVGRNIIGGMVRRIRNPGCKHDTISIFHGPQGTGKSTLASVLALRGEWFTDSIMFGTESKELVLSLAGKAVVEVSEMGMRGSTNANHIKAMISRQVDEGRTAYARSVAKRPRRNIFIGTTNSDTPLEDPSGNRRFLPVSVPVALDLDWLAQHVRQLVGEAAALETKGADFQLPVEVWGEAAERQEAVRAESDVEVRLESWFGVTDYSKAVHITAADLSQLMGLAGLRNSHSTRSGVMQALGFRRDFGVVEGKKVRVWLRGPYEAAMQCRYAVGVDAHGQARVVLHGATGQGTPTYPAPPSA